MRAQFGVIEAMTSDPSIKVLDLAGTPDQIGTAHGEDQRERIHECLERFLGWLYDGAAVTLSEQTLWPQWAPQVAFSERVAPDLVDEMHGIARGAGVPFERIFLLNSMLDLMSFRYLPMAQNFGCTTFAAVSEAGNGKTFIGQTYDMPELLQDFLLVLRIKPENGPQQLVFTFTGIVGACGLNDAGIGLTINFLSPLDVGVGRLHSTMIRQVLAAENLSDALEPPLVPPRAGGAHFLVADKKGDIISIETTGKRYEVFLPDGNAMGHTNHYLATSLKDVEIVRGGSIGSSLARYAALQRYLSKHGDQLDLESLQQLTRDHTSYPRSICAHITEDSPPGSTGCTLAALVQDLDERTMYITHGCACVSRFQRVPL